MNKYAGAVFVGFICIGLAYYVGTGAGANRKEAEMKLVEKTESVSSTNDLASIEQRLTELEKSVGEVAGNHNGLIQGLRGEFGSLQQADSAHLMSLNVLERVMRSDMGDRKFDKYIEKARENLKKELDAIAKARAKAAEAAKAKAEADKAKPKGE